MIWPSPPAMSDWREEPLSEGEPPPPPEETLRGAHSPVKKTYSNPGSGQQQQLAASEQPEPRGQSLPRNIAPPTRHCCQHMWAFQHLSVWLRESNPYRQTVVTSKLTKILVLLPFQNEIGTFFAGFLIEYSIFKGFWHFFKIRKLSRLKLRF